MNTNNDPSDYDYKATKSAGVVNFCTIVTVFYYSGAVAVAVAVFVAVAVIVMAIVVIHFEWPR